MKESHFLCWQIIINVLVCMFMGMILKTPEEREFFSLGLTACEFLLIACEGFFTEILLQCFMVVVFIEYYRCYDRPVGLAVLIVPPVWCFVINLMF